MKVCVVGASDGLFLTKKQGCAHSCWSSVEAFVVPLGSHISTSVSFFIWKYDRNCYYGPFPWPIICTHYDKEPVLLGPITMMSLWGG